MNNIMMFKVSIPLQWWDHDIVLPNADVIIRRSINRAFSQTAVFEYNTFIGHTKAYTNV